jgi:hypothetical protein
MHRDLRKNRLYRQVAKLLNQVPTETWYFWTILRSLTHFDVATSILSGIGANNESNLHFENQFSKPQKRLSAKALPK